MCLGITNTAFPKTEVSFPLQTTATIANKTHQVYIYTNTCVCVCVCVCVWTSTHTVQCTHTSASWNGAA